jgi:hypothetical protein
MIVRMKCRALALALFLASCVLFAQAPAAAANPFLGSWKRNAEKSGTPQPGLILVRQYQDQGGGLMLHTIIILRPDMAGFVFAAVRYDGKEYPIYYPDSLGALLSAGVKSTWTMTVNRINVNTLEYTDRQDGKITGTGVSKVSEDGKILTDTSKGFDREGKQTSNSVSVFDKQ